MLLISVNLSALDYGGKIKSYNQYVFKNSSFITVDENIIVFAEHETKDFKIYTELKYEHDFFVGNDVKHEVQIREGYINFYIEEDIELLMGKKIIIWGKTDEFNPVDFITAEDLRYFMMKEKGDRAIGSPTLMGTLSFGDTSFVLAILPVVQGNKFPAEESYWATVQQGEVSDTKIENPQVAAKLSTVMMNTDIDLIYYNGYSHVPMNHMSFNKSELQFVLKSVYDRFNGYGLAFVKAADAVTFRGEIAYRDNTEQFALNESLYYETPTIDLNLGLDYRSSNDFYINIQYVMSWIEDYEEVIVRERKIDFLFAKMEQTYLNDGLLLSLNIGINFWNVGHDKDVDLFLNPEATYTWFNKFKTEIGVQLFDGTQNTFFGQFANNTLVYGNVEIPF
jgi:hypothetical protein